jgi:hypothetical protein
MGVRRTGLENYWCWLKGCFKGIYVRVKSKPLSLRKNARKASQRNYRIYLSSNTGAVSPFAYFANESPERYRIWPLGGIYANGQCYQFNSVIEVFGGGQWDFRGVGSDLGRSKVALGPYERL